MITQKERESAICALEDLNSLKLKGEDSLPFRRQLVRLATSWNHPDFWINVFKDDADMVKRFKEATGWTES